MWSDEAKSRILAGTPQPTDWLWVDPCRILTGLLTPDPWQRACLESTAPRLAILASRQSGKSTTAAAIALREALTIPGSLTLVLSPSLRQSGEFFRAKLMTLWKALGCPLADRETSLELDLSNGSRVISLPGTEGTVRGYSSVSLLVVDEAALVEDSLYFAVRPMLAVSSGRLIALSTPRGLEGWFHAAWHGKEDWHRVKVLATECPRISPQFLASERAALGPKIYAMEYMCEFLPMTGARFSPEDVRAAVRSDRKSVKLEMPT